MIQLLCPGNATLLFLPNRVKSWSQGFLNLKCCMCTRVFHEKMFLIKKNMLNPLCKYFFFLYFSFFSIDTMQVFRGCFEGIQKDFLTWHFRETPYKCAPKIHQTKLHWSGKHACQSQDAKVDLDWSFSAHPCF